MTGSFIFHPKTAEYRCQFLRHCCLIILLLFLFANPGNTSANISAEYTKSQGTELVVSITVTAPSPSLLILMQKLPPGVQMVNSEPPAMNDNTKKGVVKWLIREVTPGTHTIRLFLNREVTAKEISASIRYKPASGGGMETQPVAKP